MAIIILRSITVIKHLIGTSQRRRPSTLRSAGVNTYNLTNKCHQKS